MPERSFSELIQRYQPGGQFDIRKAGLLGQAKTTSAENVMRGQVMAGLGGVTSPVTETARHERNVGAGFRRGLEGVRVGNLTNALLAKAGFLETEDVRKLGIKKQKEAQARGEEDFAKYQLDLAAGMRSRFPTAPAYQTPLSQPSTSSRITPLSQTYRDIAVQQQVYGGGGTYNFPQDF